MWVFIDADQAPMDESVGADGAVIQLVTRCESEDEFIERFARFATPTDVVVPALPHVTAGASGRFVIHLKDQTTVMAGRCEVSVVVPMAAAPGAPQQSGRALMRLRLIDMDARSRGVHLRLLERRASAGKPAPTPPVVVRPTTAPALSIVRPPPPTPPPVVTSAPPVTPPPVSAPAARVPLPGSTMNVMTTPRPPLRRQAVPMPTLIGTPATLGLAGPSFSVAAAPPLADLETTEVSAIPKLETRAPGAALTLPANPLSDLDADDLASFVEFQLLETEGADSAAVSLTGKVKVDPEAAAAALPAAAPPAPATPAPVAASASTWTAKVRLDPRFERAVQIARRGWPYASCVVVGLLLGIALRPGAKPAAVSAPQRAVAAATPAAPEPAPSPALAPPTVADAPAPAPAAARKAAASIPGGCMATVSTTPPDASVVWGDVPLGTGRIARASVPCGKAVVTIRHDRYADVTRTMTAQPGQMATLSERMHRPPAKVIIASVPARAHIKMNGRPIGAAPRQLNTNRFEQVRIDASLPGYQPWSKTLYLRQAETRIDVELVAIPKPAPAARPKSARPNGK
jgi:hypothetical protein